MNTIADHVTYIADRIGKHQCVYFLPKAMQCLIIMYSVGIGSDYDGIEITPEGLEDVSKYPYLACLLFTFRFFMIPDPDFTVRRAYPSRMVSS